MLTVFLLTACSNLTPRVFYPEGGSRHATGTYYVPADTGDSGEEDSGYTEGSAYAPVISDIETTIDEQTRSIAMLIHYTDAQDDLVGGAVAFNVTFEGGAAVPNSREVLDVADGPDVATQAIDHGEYVEVHFEPLGSGSHVVDFIELADAAGNRSDLWAQEIAVP